MCSRIVVIFFVSAILKHLLQPPWYQMGVNATQWMSRGQSSTRGEQRAEQRIPPVNMSGVRANERLNGKGCIFYSCFRRAFESQILCVFRPSVFAVHLSLHINPCQDLLQWFTTNHFKIQLSNKKICCVAKHRNKTGGKHSVTASINNFRDSTRRKKSMGKIHAGKLQCFIALKNDFFPLMTLYII